MTILYFCYQSLMDPLTWSQVVAYLEGLARAGYRPILVTFESHRLPAEERARMRQRLGRRGIRWRSLRYHKTPTVPATAWDIACGIALGFWLIRRHGVRLIHARSHVPAVMAAALAVLTRRPFLFDIRGFLAEEYADAGVWRDGGWLFRLVRAVERRLAGRAEGIVVLTERAATSLRDRYPSEVIGKPIEIIPCCVDLRDVPGAPPGPAGDSAEGDAGLVYVGKLGGRYVTRSLVDLFAAARRQMPGLRWTVLTQSDPSELRAHATDAGLDDLIRIDQVGHDRLFAELGRARAGVCLHRGERSAFACSPTKIAEYLATGLAVVASSDLGDVARVLRGADDGEPVGVLVDDRDPRDLERAAAELRRLLDDPGLAARCRVTAVREFDLESIGWPRYRRIYGRLLGEDGR